MLNEDVDLRGVGSQLQATLLYQQFNVKVLFLLLGLLSENLFYKLAKI